MTRRSTVGCTAAAVFAGTATSDIDVVSVEAIFNRATHVFTILGTMAGNIDKVSTAAPARPASRASAPPTCCSNA